jgi:hypothetical protein
MAFRFPTYQPLADHIEASRNPVNISVVNGQWVLEYGYYTAIPAGVPLPPLGPDHPAQCHYVQRTTLHDALVELTGQLEPARNHFTGEQVATS